MVETHLKELLYKHSRVVIPGFGTLMAHNCPSEQNSTKHTLTPPRKKLTFHATDEGNDGLLLNRLQHAGADLHQANELLFDVASGWKKKLQNENSVQIEGIGTLFRTRDGSIQFASDKDVNYLPSSFGLAQLDLRPITREEAATEPQKPQVLAREGRIHLRTAEEIEEEESPLLPWLKYASMILLLISVTATAYFFYTKEQEKRERIDDMVNMELTGHIEGSVFYQESPLKLPPVEVEVRNKYHVVAGAYRLRENADRRLKELRNEGYDAKYLGENKFSLHQVAFGSFETRREARKLLSEINESSGESDAWILELVLP